MKKIFKNKKVIICLLIVICLVSGGAFTYNNFISEKGQVKRVTNKLLKSIKIGNINTKYIKDTKEFETDFNQIFDYEILSVSRINGKDETKKYFYIVCRIDTNNEKGQKCTKRCDVFIDNTTGNYKATEINTNY